MATATKTTQSVLAKAVVQAIDNARVWARANGGEVLHIDTADCAKIMKAALAEAFPFTKFSVRTERYSGGSHVNVEWTDGPTTKQVDAVVQRYSGASFDGMIDLKSYHDSTLAGRTVHYGCDWPSTRRNYSVDFLRRRCETIAAKYHVPMAEIRLHSDGTAYVVSEGEPLERYADGSVANWNSRAGDLVDQLAVKTAVARG